MREIHEYVDEKCQLATSNVLVFEGIYKMTNMNPCHGCGYNHNNKCPVFLKFKREGGIPIRNPKYPSLMTNAQLASELGISKRQVSKLRIHGTNLITR